jgi:hypothetical protein
MRIHSSGLSAFATGAATCLLLIGCVSTESPANPPDGGTRPPTTIGGPLGTDGSTPTDGSAAPAAVDCAPVIECVSACGTSTCENGCMASATAETAQRVTAFAVCAQINACSDSACIKTHCAAELAACGLAIGDAGAVAPADDASTVSPTDDAGTVAPDGAPDGGNIAIGSITVNGRCDHAAGNGNSGACWDFAYAVDGGGNTFVETYFYYTGMLASSGQSTCAGDNNQTFSAPAGNTPLSAQTQASTILGNKRRACDLLGGTFTEGPAGCSTGGSFGHCTETGANVYDAPSDSVTMRKTTTWATP